MLNEARITCKALDAHYGPELCRLIGSAIIELKARKIAFDGAFTYTTALEEKTGLLIVSGWTCTITDEWVKTAILAYVKGHFSGIKDAEKYQAAFDRMMDTMMNTTGYATWEGGAET